MSQKRKLINNWYLNNLIHKTTMMVRRWKWGLPSTIHWRLTKSQKVAGETDYDTNTIILSSFLINEPPKAVITILLHELAHLSVYYGYRITGHGKHWQQLIQDANYRTGLNISECVDIEDLPVLYTNLNKGGK